MIYFSELINSHLLLYLLQILRWNEKCIILNRLDYRIFETLLASFSYSFKKNFHIYFERVIGSSNVRILYLYHINYAVNLN